MHAHSQTGSGRGGLTSILSQPKQASKLVGKTGPQPMIPYTLTRRPPPPPAKRKKRPAKAAADVGGDSDSDGEPVGFFSHLESTTVDPLQRHKRNLPPDVPGSGYDVVVRGDSSLDAAPMATKPFTVEEEVGGVWEEGFPYPMVDSGGADGEGEVVDERFEHPAMHGVGCKAGPGLNMDEQAVSD